jgi:DNA-binding winged helix-turn-helix (wHTH) protein/Tol biopolymer transport system component
MPENIPALRVVPPERRLRFGPFELDSRAGELRKHGIKIRIGPQTFEILLMLLRHPGEVVLREEIRQKLWPLDTVVEFDHSINAAIQKLRDALGESAGDARYIETLPRRGYRFLGTVEMPPAETVTEETPPEVSPVQAAPGNRYRLIFAAAITLVAILALVLWLRPWETRAPVKNWSLSLSLGRADAVVSPDGSAIVYSNSRGLCWRRLDSLEEIPIYTQAHLNDSPTWSPDGSQVFFRAGWKLIRLPVPNGPPVTLWPETGITRGFSWGPDGTILMAALKNNMGELSLLPANGGDPVRVEVPGLTNGRFFYPEFLPDGKNVLFAWSREGDDEPGLYLATWENGGIARRPILLRRNTTAGHYTPSGGGRLLYVRSDKLYAQKLNVHLGTLEGEPERVVDGVYSESGWSSPLRASFSVSRNGVLAWLGGRVGLAQLTWFDRRGRVSGTAGPPCTGVIAGLSPDERHVLVHTIADHEGFGIVEENRSGQVALPGITREPLWMPDSAHILYGRKEGDGYVLLERAAEGGPEKPLGRLPALARLHDVSADGKIVLYKEGISLYSTRLDGSPEMAKPQLVAETMQGRFSPDGRWVVYSAAIGDRRELFAQPFPLSGLRTQLTSAGGQDGVWRGDGKEILYRNGSTIYSLRVEVKGNTIHAGPPEALFDVRLPAGLVFDSMPLAVTRDGSKILFTQGVEQPSPQLTYVMTAWDTLLRR